MDHLPRTSISKTGLVSLIRIVDDIVFGLFRVPMPVATRHGEHRLHLLLADAETLVADVQAISGLMLNLGVFGLEASFAI